MRWDGDGDDGADGGDGDDDGGDSPLWEGNSPANFSLLEPFFSLSGFRFVEAAE